MNLLQHFVNVNGIGRLPFALFFLVSLAGLLRSSGPATSVLYNKVFSNQEVPVWRQGPSWFFSYFLFVAATFS